MFASTSQSETTFTGATCNNLNKSLLPYHPVPIKPTFHILGGVSKPIPDIPKADKVNVAAAPFNNWRRV